MPSDDRVIFITIRNLFRDWCVFLSERMPKKRLRHVTFLFSQLGEGEL